MKYILGIDQSTQSTKVLLFDEKGVFVDKVSLAHEQIVNELGYVEHNLDEIYGNLISAVKLIVDKTKIEKEDICCVGISNQRETTACWLKDGTPLCNAVVWQCARAKGISERVAKLGYKDYIEKSTGIKLSPYFPASKLAWILENVENAREYEKKGILYFGTIDTYLIYKLTHGQSYKTDYSNASRTQLFNINELKWDDKICGIFGINSNELAEVCDSDDIFGMTDFEGYLDKEIPIQGILGDSHAALYAQGCFNKGKTKVTYGTGSSVMMNIGQKPIVSNNGLVTSLAWKVNNQINYVLEGNINYTGAVISWMINDLKIIDSPNDCEPLIELSNKNDTTYLIPAFSGLGAPYWNSDAKALICGMSRTSGKPEIVKAAVESIAYQIADVIKAMEEDVGFKLEEIRVDGAPTKNNYLMQFQADILGCTVVKAQNNELSGTGVAYLSGIAGGIYDSEQVFENLERQIIQKQMSPEESSEKYKGWKDAVTKAL